MTLVSIFPQPSSLRFESPAEGIDLPNWIGALGKTDCSHPIKAPGEYP